MAAKSGFCEFRVVDFLGLLRDFLPERYPGFRWEEREWRFLLQELKNPSVQELLEYENTGNHPLGAGAGKKSQRKLWKDLLELLSEAVPSPVEISTLPGIPYEFARSLGRFGIWDTVHMLDAGLEENELARKTGIPVNRLKEIRALSELILLPWGSGNVARIMYEMEIRSLKILSRTDRSKAGPFRELSRVRELTVAQPEEQYFLFWIAYAGKIESRTSE